MSQTELIEAIIAYALIPLFTFGLLLLVALIAHYQLGFLSHRPQSEIKQLFSPGTYTPGTYIIVALLFVAITVLALADSKRREG